MTKRWQIFIVSLFFTISLSLFISAAQYTAPLFKGMGTYHHSITTDSSQAQ